MKTKWSTEFVLIVLALIPIIYLAYVWKHLPDIVPTHFNMEKKPDSFGNKTTLIWLIALTSIFTYVLMFVLPKIDPRYKNYDAFSGTLLKLRIAIGALTCFIGIIIIRSALTGTINTNFLLVVILGFIAFLGNYMSTVKPNFFIGLRTPWTLDNEVVWRKSHHVLGKLWFYGAIVLLGLLLIIPEKIFFILFLTFIIGSAIFGIVYSYILFKKETQNSHE